MIKNHRSAFTLVELLVVVVIIFILLTIVLGGLGAVRNYANRSLCISNQRQIMLATRNYSVNYAGYLPFNNWAGLTGTTGLTPGWAYMPNAYPMIAAYSDSLYPQILESSALWPFLSTERTTSINPATGVITSLTSTVPRASAVYRCPADPPPWDADIVSAGDRGGTHRFTSYIMNGASCAYGGHTMYRLYQMRFAGDGVAMWEADSTPLVDQLNSYGRGGGNGGLFNDGCSFPGEGLSQRHIIGAPVGCYDGHAEYILFADYYNMAAASGYNRLWCQP